MKRYAPILLSVLWLTGGCATTPRPSAYDAWQSQLTEGQSLTLRAAVIAADVFNETYDHTIQQLKTDTNLVASLRDKINVARRLYRQAKSWNLTEMPLPPEQPTLAFPNHWVLTAPGLPVEIDYEYALSTYGKRNFFALKIVTLRGKKDMSWADGTEPVWFEPFGSFVDGDRVDLDVENLLLHTKIDRE